MGSLPREEDLHEALTLREKLRRRREAHVERLRCEAERLAGVAASLGVQRVVLFGSVPWGEPGLGSDLDLLVVWDTPLDYLERIVTLYRRLQPQVPLDLLVYTPEEMAVMAHRPLVRRALERGVVLYES